MSYKVYDSINIRTKDNGIVTVSVVLNSTGNPKNTILINTIYADPKNIDRAKYFAQKGYAGVILNTRGKYLSPDPIEPFEHETEDINTVIDWIVEQPWSNGKVGMIGGSYLGFSQWAAAKKLNPALKTIIPQASVGVGVMDFPMRNHIFMSYTLRWLDQVMNSKMTDNTDFNNTQKWNSVYKSWYESGKQFRKLDSISGKPNPVFQKWLNHPDEDEYWQRMIPDEKDFEGINIPVLSTTGYFDWNQRGAMHYFLQHTKFNKNAEHYLIIGPYDHAGSQGNINKTIKNFSIDPVAKIDLHKIFLEWFDYILNGKPKPSFLKDKINYQVIGDNQWKSISSFNAIARQKLYMTHTPDGNILSDTRSDKANFTKIQVDLKNRLDTDELLNLKYNIIDSHIYEKNNVVFTSKPFVKPFELTGNFTGQLNFSVNKKDVDIYMNLYELMNDGKYFLLSNNLSRASYSANNKKRDLLVPGRKEIISIYNSEFISKRIAKGSRLVLMIGLVKSPFWEINYGTGKAVSDETIDDAKEPVEIKFYNDSYIEIPIIKD
ncbi:CocE/NonD family hydrolase [Chryseobacterium sp. JUb7]|uniref:CocE/NonD family hydrolase n=1 Tax=Chryseobacterium sp. JUb7 TaxID=2940599 RepID=UPI0021677C1E|nr:CocE/NonD family hydrolase [Chryseobacterium sp. JUb7]MCS3530799.1 putative CocE/NonD family hydrolase [Chryseobacterium sp. JUb7]